MKLLSKANSIKVREDDRDPVQQNPDQADLLSLAGLIPFFQAAKDEVDGRIQIGRNEAGCGILAALAVPSSVP
jgi:hypothetical protein